VDVAQLASDGRAWLAYVVDRGWHTTFDADDAWRWLRYARHAMLRRDYRAWTPVPPTSNVETLEEALSVAIAWLNDHAAPNGASRGANGEQPVTDKPATKGKRSTERGDGPVRPIEAKRATINARMLDMLQSKSNLDATGWTVEQWAERLDCAKSTVHRTPAWRGLHATHVHLATDHEIKTGKRTDRRRTPKGSDLRKGQDADD
jgi:hypothetical protein